MLNISFLHSRGFLKLMACTTLSQTCKYWISYSVTSKIESDYSLLGQKRCWWSRSKCIGILCFLSCILSWLFTFQIFNGLLADIVYFFLAVCWIWNWGKHSASPDVHRSLEILQHRLEEHAAGIGCCINI